MCVVRSVRRVVAANSEEIDTGNPGQNEFGEFHKLSYKVLKSNDKIFETRKSSPDIMEEIAPWKEFRNLWW